MKLISDYGITGRLLLSASLAVMMSACTLLGSPPLAKTTYFQTQKAKFVFNEETVQYDMSYLILKELSIPLKVKVEFENPKDAARPFVVEKILNPGMKQLDIKSPDLGGIRNSHKYLVILNLYSIQDGMKRVDKHSQYIHFRHSSHLLKRAGVTVYETPLAER